MENKNIQSVCVQCGSSKGNCNIFAEEAEKLGQYLAQRNISLIYGGSGVGLMGIIARTILKNGGIVIGIIPKRIHSMVEMIDVTELYEVDTMTERKTMMTEKSDAFIAMPGGFGTLDEITDAMVLNQLEYIHKPVGLLNINGYYDKLLEFLLSCEEYGFIRPQHRKALQVARSAPELFDKLTNYNIEHIDKWWD